MTDLIFWSASMVTGFVAGVVALFAPCCLTVLLPTYLAQIVQTRVKVVMATLVFSLGIASVMLPIALGFRAIVGIFNNYHPYFYGWGGALMIVVGILLIAQWKLPMLIRPSALPHQATFGSLFLLGITSGLATACCAPVLAGAILVTALSPSTLLAILVGVAYVIGMVLPLLLGAIMTRSDYLLRFKQTMNRPVGASTIGSILGGLTMISYGTYLVISVAAGRLINAGDTSAFTQRALGISRNVSQYLNENSAAAIIGTIAIIILVGWCIRTLNKKIDE